MLLLLLPLSHSEWALENLIERIAKGFAPLYPVEMKPPISRQEQVYDVYLSHLCCKRYGQV